MRYATDVQRTNSILASSNIASSVVVIVVGCIHNCPSVVCSVVSVKLTRAKLLVEYHRGATILS